MRQKKIIHEQFQCYKFIFSFRFKSHCFGFKVIFDTIFVSERSQFIFSRF